MRKRCYEAFAPTTGPLSPTDNSVAVDITDQVRHNPAIVAEEQRKHEVEEQGDVRPTEERVN